MTPHASLVPPQTHIAAALISLIKSRHKVHVLFVFILLDGEAGRGATRIGQLPVL